MKPYKIAIVIVLIPMLLGGLYWIGERNGYNKAVAKYNAEAAKITEQALAEQSRMQQVIDDQAYIFHTSISAERIAHEQTKAAIKQKPTIQACTDSGDGAPVAILTGDTIRMLDKARSSPALPEARNTQGVAGEKNTATANDLAIYTEYGISEYNQCAIQINALIGVVESIK